MYFNLGVTTHMFKDDFFMSEYKVPRNYLTGTAGAEAVKSESQETFEEGLTCETRTVRLNRNLYSAKADLDLVSVFGL